MPDSVSTAPIRQSPSARHDARGLECDLLYRNGENICAIEIKSGATVASDWFVAFDKVPIPQISSRVVVYGGAARQPRQAGEVLPLADLSAALERFEAEQ